MGPLLFLIYINDIDEGLTSRVAKSAGDAKLWINAGGTALIEALQTDLNKLGERSETWQMPFNCTVIHIG